MKTPPQVCHSRGLYAEKLKRGLQLPVGTAVLAWTLAGPVYAADFAHDIAPIVYRACAPCHHAGGTAPFPLVSYGDVSKRAVQIAAVTRNRYMPPWLPTTDVHFEGERRLTDAEIRTISDWAAAGAPEGPAGRIPSPPDFPAGWQLGPPDMVLEAPAAFQAPASGPDVYWNFVLRNIHRSPVYVRAVEIRPGGGPALVHHANLLVDRMAASHLREIAPGKGFPGMDLEVMRSPFDPPGHFMFWKPGSAPHQEPDGFAWRLNPTDELVLNVHLRPSGKPEQARPEVGLYFTDKPQTHFPLLVQLENDQALDIPAGARDFVVSDDFRLPLDVDALAVYPHAHYLGKRLEAYATLPDGSRRWLIRILDWNPDWQAVYYYREPVFLPKGTLISMRYHYDNSTANVRNPHHPPRRVVGGDQSTDEMAHLWLELLPRGAQDRRRELEEAAIRHKLERNPKDFTANMNLGAVMLSRLDAAGAAGPLEAAVSADPRRAEARAMLGLALEQVGRAAEAITEFAAAVRLRPDFTAARFNLANAQLRAGNLDAAIENLRRVVAEDPNDQLPKRRLEEALERQRERARQAKQ
ncbi:MAG TPA: tetratricopeptide repeat protein [Bryobacteraceae bacterium]|nr:tetratricopeptide repeat protein [Bryobacteraceae bacterium]